MMENFKLSNKISVCEECDNCIINNVIETQYVKKFIKLLKAKIKTISKHQVVNGKANPEYIKYFSEGERIGMENERELVLQIIDELIGDLK